MGPLNLNSRLNCPKLDYTLYYPIRVFFGWMRGTYVCNSLPPCQIIGCSWMKGALGCGRERVSSGGTSHWVLEHNCSCIILFICIYPTRLNSGSLNLVVFMLNCPEEISLRPLSSFYWNPKSPSKHNKNAAKINIFWLAAPCGLGFYTNFRENFCCWMNERHVHMQ